MVGLKNITIGGPQGVPGKGYGSFYKLDERGPFIIGRSWEANSPVSQDVVLESKYVSTPHCFIIPYRGRFYLGDFGSKNGTYLNEDRVPSSFESKIFKDSISDVQKQIMHSVFWTEEDGSSRLISLREPQEGFGKGMSKEEKIAYLKQSFNDRLCEKNFKERIIRNGDVEILKNRDIIGVADYRLRFHQGFFDKIINRILSKRS